MEEKIIIEGNFLYVKRLVILYGALGVLDIIMSIVVFSASSFLGIPIGIFCIFLAYQAYNVKKQKLVITRNGIYGHTPKEEFDLPISKIITVNLVKSKRLRITVPSKKFKFYACTNAEDVYKTLINLINNNEDNKTENQNVKSIKEYKELFDMGVITQEEFELKKKELLGL